MTTQNGSDSVGYAPKGKLTNIKIRGKRRLVDNWIKNGKRVRHLLTKDQESEFNDNLTEEYDEVPRHDMRTPEKELPKPNEYINKKFPPLNVDGKALEIFGTVEDISVENNNIYLSIINSENHIEKALMNSQTVMRTIRQYANIHEFSTVNFKRNAEYRKDIVERIKETGIKILVRIDTQIKKQQYVYSVHSSKWAKIKIDDLLPIINRANDELSATSLEVQLSDGLDGGQATLNFESPYEDVHSTQVVVSAGLLNGFSSIRVTGQIIIDGSLTQISTELSPLMQSIAGEKFYMRRIHSGEIPNIMYEIKQTIRNTERIYEAFSKSMDIELSNEKVIEILEHYQGRNIISGKTKNHIMAVYLDEEKIGLPGNLWSLIMSISWVGTCGDVKEGVSKHLQCLSGDLSIATNHWSEYQNLIQGEC